MCTTPFDSFSLFFNNLIKKFFNFSLCFLHFSNCPELMLWVPYSEGYLLIRKIRAYFFEFFLPNF